MKWYWLLCLATLAVAEEELELAEPCDPVACQLPDCRCSSTQIPGNLLARDTPQFITVTFDDGVSVTNIETYRETVYGRRNSNGCPAGVTFYVSHEYTNYQLVNELYNQGFEIALHSISHQTPQTSWQEADPDFLRQEIADQKRQMAHFANIPQSQIHGVRLPFLQMAGNNSFLVMEEAGLTYDCTWVTINNVNPGLWPYTLDYESTQDCQSGPCPTASFPGLWVQPMVAWQDMAGLPCAMADSCFHTNIPALTDEEGWFQFILTNFERHYMGNRAPFGFYIHEWYLASNPAVKRAFIRFLDVINELPDAFMVNSNEVIEWIKNPVPVNEYKQQPCRWFQAAACPASSCGPLTAQHTEMTYYMQICNACPRVYPWLGNPLGA